MPAMLRHAAGPGVKEAHRARQDSVHQGGCPVPGAREARSAPSRSEPSVSGKSPFNQVPRSDVSNPLLVCPPGSEARKGLWRDTRQTQKPGGHESRAQEEDMTGTH